MKKPFFILFILASLTTTSQEQGLLKGQIIADSLEASLINIINLQREIGTTNTSSGSFEIEAEVGDTLLFSSVQYEIQEIFISDRILEKGYLEVSLVPMMNELEEVNISNISLSGNLSSDLSNIETFDQASVGFPLSSVSRKTSVERRIYGASSSPLMLIINMLNGRLKRLKRAKKNMEYESFIDLGVDIFPKEFYDDYLQIPEDKIRLFVYYCGEDSRFEKLLIKREALPLIELYLEKAAEFWEMHNIEVERNPLFTLPPGPDEVRETTEDSLQAIGNSKGHLQNQPVQDSEL
ncbi:MAG TPA: hypothetical protein ENO10_05080 [Salinimicrobium catena]|uniref:CarboxypepD_reg-like domain-containing protein n=1 Tax=Salinimicrobium catena TaxID=390640 RepID=A0A7C2RQE0_9FLAO|nr:hypothetical protein [Salinimicrobium catena]